MMRTQALDVLSVMLQFLAKAWYLLDRITRGGHAHT
jgi:hypothetical protein